MLEPLTDPLLALWDGLVRSVPGIIAAIAVLIIGYIIAWALGRLVKAVLTRLDADKWLMKKTSIKKLMGDFRLSRFLGLITKWYVFVLFLPPAAEVVQLRSLSAFLYDVAVWIPQLIAGVVIALVGLLAADYVSAKINETKAKAAGLVALIARVVILVFTALIVLRQINVQVQVAESSFLIVLAGIMLGVSLALGISFGLGGKEDAKKWIKDLKKKL